jgi:hypothetical protein
MDAIDLDALMDRLRARAADPDRRVDQRGSRFDARVRGMALGELITTDRSVADMLAAVVTDNRAGRIDPTRLAAVSALAAEMDEPVDGDLGPPLTDDAIDGADATLGLRLPLALRRAYRDVADGGFGPVSGLLPLARARALLSDFRRESPGPRRSTWPVPYLPLVSGPDGCDLVDCATGTVYAWDPGGLGEHSRDATWRRSFSPLAPSVEKWLDGWSAHRLLRSARRPSWPRVARPRCEHRSHTGRAGRLWSVHGTGCRRSAGSGHSSGIYPSSMRYTARAHKARFRPGAPTHDERPGSLSGQGSDLGALIDETYPSSLQTADPGLIHPAPQPSSRSAASSFAAVVTAPMSTLLRAIELSSPRTSSTAISSTQRMDATSPSPATS